MNTRIEPISFEYVKIPALRFIGTDAWRTKEDWGNMWKRKYEFLPQIRGYLMRYLNGYWMIPNGQTKNFEQILNLFTSFQKFHGYL